MEKLTHVESGDKAAPPEQHPSGDVLELQEERDLKRGLAQRHVSMIALAGAPVS